MSLLGGFGRSAHTRDGLRSKELNTFTELFRLSPSFQSNCIVHMRSSTPVNTHTHSKHILYSASEGNIAKFVIPLEYSVHRALFRRFLVAQTLGVLTRYLQLLLRCLFDLGMLHF